MKIRGCEKVVEDMKRRFEVDFEWFRRFQYNVYIDLDTRNVSYDTFCMGNSSNDCTGMCYVATWENEIPDPIEIEEQCRYALELYQSGLIGRYGNHL